MAKTEGLGLDPSIGKLVFCVPKQIGDLINVYCKQTNIMPGKTEELLKSI